MIPAPTRQLEAFTGELCEAEGGEENQARAARRPSRGSAACRRYSGRTSRDTAEQELLRPLFDKLGGHSRTAPGTLYGFVVHCGGGPDRCLLLQAKWCQIRMVVLSGAGGRGLWQCVRGSRTSERR